jgi:ATP-dependent Clp protease ATP-binding subunit ClpA
MENLSKHLNPEVRQAVAYAKAASHDAKLDTWYPDSLAVGILTTGKNEVNVMLMAMGVDLEDCLKKFKANLKKKQKYNKKGDIGISFSELIQSKQVREIFRIAEKMRKEEGSEKITLPYVFIALLRVSKYVLSVFEKQMIDAEVIEEYLRETKEATHTTQRSSQGQSRSQHQGHGPEPEPELTAFADKGVLSSFCIDVTEKAERNELDPIIAREKEIEDAITILCRRNKNNPVLIGEAGVGKTAVVEGLAQRIVSGVVPKQLMNYRVYSLNLAGMISGTKYRGEFEQRIQGLIDEVEKSSNVVIFIDEIHTLVGAGGTGNSPLDASNILKPFLTKNKVKCIGATTIREYKTYFEKDSALERRFQQIMIEEPTKEQVSKILLGVRDRLEEYHECKIEDKALEAVVELTGQYMSNRKFPDKAIDCLDLACAKYAWDYSNETPIIKKEDIERVISERCKIPLEIISCKSNQRVEQINSIMKERIIGQDHAVDSISRILKNAYSGVRDPNRPIGNFVFGGQSGTGKTQTAKQLAFAVFGRDTDLIKLDMTEFSESYSVSKLIGSAPGYVGHAESEVFVDKVRRNPYCIILLDEIEKADKQVVKVFLQAMSDGVMTDTSGNKVDFKNVIFIMTGNFGIDDIKTDSVGFAEENIEKRTLLEIEREKIVSFCKENYGMEFVNRVDEFVPFVSLDDDSLKKIVEIMLNDIKERIHIEIAFGKRVYDQLISLAKNQHGQNANPLKRIISSKIEPCLANAILSTPDHENKIITVSVKGNDFVATLKEKRPKKTNSVKTT